MINLFSKYKSVFYISNIILIFLYLYPFSLIGYFLYNDPHLQPKITEDFLISSNHLYAFFLLSVIGYFTFLNSSRLNFLIIYLILLSVILELFHFVIPMRSFEFSDLFGNLFGVVILIIINFIYKKYENSKN